MTETKANGDKPPVLQVPARALPIPSTISPAAQAALAAQIAGPSMPPHPPADQPEVWRAHVANIENAMAAYARQRASNLPTDTHDRVIGAATTYIATPRGRTDLHPGVFLNLHGGALVVGGGESCRIGAAELAHGFAMQLWSVDYRMPPDHPYPAGLDDCVAAYRALLAERAPQEIFVGGISAGANLAAALILRARDEGLPLPAGALLLAPEVDLTESGDSFRANLGLDTVLRGSMMNANRLYANGHDLAHPYLSPLFGDFAKGFPPTLLSAGTRDMFLSNAVLMHRKLRRAGVRADLHVFEAASHGIYGGTPEGEDLMAECRRFMREIV